ncbi:hypothetical protein [Sphingomonas sp.]
MALAPAHGESEASPFDGAGGDGDPPAIATQLQYYVLGLWCARRMRAVR